MSDKHSDTEGSADYLPVVYSISDVREVPGSLLSSKGWLPLFSAGIKIFYCAKLWELFLKTRRLFFKFPYWHKPLVIMRDYHLPSY